LFQINFVHCNAAGSAIRN